MINKTKLLALASLVFLAACNDSEDGGPGVEIVISQVPENVLSAFFVADWAPFEAAATALRTLNPLYTVQQFSWWNGPGTPVFDSYSLANGRIEYAHAAGLTGAGQIISIVDAGFLQSHVEFSGKTIYVPAGPALPVDDHGTTVASIAAGVATGGQIIGVAPGADLALGWFDSDATRTAANNQAIALGAIVQNNSWGFEIDVNVANFQTVFSGPSGLAYYASIKNLAENAVIVFAASNNASRTTADIMGALPLLDPSLQDNWLTVINAVPVFSGSTITSATVVSARCLEAAAWCLAADGSVYGAVSSGNSAYDNAFGTSFAAPQVAGAIALLAEAFPTLNAEELRARLLASADNSFFTQTGYVEFSPTVIHGFSAEFGHGFLNMRAALLPIGGSYIPRSGGGTTNVSSPVVLSAGLVGDALTRSLASYDLVMADGLGSGFDAPASILSAQALPGFDALGSINDLLATDLSSSASDPFSPVTGFSPFAAGREMGFEAQDTRVAMLFPDPDSGSYGVAVSRGWELPGSELRLGLRAMYEGNGFVGVQSLQSDAALTGIHGAATWEWDFKVARDQQLSLSGSFGLARPNGEIPDMSLSQVAYNSLNLSYSLRNVWGMGDRVALGIGLPDAVQAGSASVTLPTSRGADGTVFSTVDIPLTPEGRQLDLSVAYGVPLSRRSDVIFRAVRSLNDSNIAGQVSTEATIGFRIQF